MVNMCARVSFYSAIEIPHNNRVDLEKKAIRGQKPIGGHPERDTD